MKLEGFADRVSFSIDQDIMTERLLRAALRYRKACGRKRIDEREVARAAARLNYVIADLPGGLLTRFKRWRKGV
jgi:hypothetical protein